jgi:ketosteroid isomerase-like protein
MSREDVEVVRQVFDAVGRRDAEGVPALYDPDVELDISRTKYVELLGRGVYRGHKGIRQAYGAWFEAWENTEMYCEELIDAGEHVISVAGYQGRGRASGVQSRALPSSASGRSATERSSGSFGSRRARRPSRPPVAGRSVALCDHDAAEHPGAIPARR